MLMLKCRSATWTIVACCWNEPFAIVNLGLSGPCERSAAEKALKKG